MKKKRGKKKIQPVSHTPPLSFMEQNRKTYDLKTKWLLDSDEERRGSMCSELLWHSKDFYDPLAEEFKRRMGLLRLSKDQIKQVYLHDIQSLALWRRTYKYAPFQDNVFNQRNLFFEVYRTTPWSMRSYIDMPLDKKMPDCEELSLSELVGITDDANYRIETGSVSKENSKSVMSAAQSWFEQRYKSEFYERMKRFDWNYNQAEFFWDNELLLIQRYKHFKEVPDAWSKRVVFYSRKYISIFDLVNIKDVG